MLKIYKRITIFCLVLTITLEISARTSKELEVQLPNGSRLVGRYLTSDSGRGIKAFMGVPYAEPPIGELRFKPPKDKKPWDGVLQAHFDSPVCIQRDPFRRDFEISGSEDCLYLNVYTPQNVNKSLIPVMVFFHGGGFMCGSGIKPFYGPDYLLEHDIVYIGANFRLGPLGFLSTESEDCWGNWGLKDQSQILKWINKNIEAFGGDLNSVTIFGESAGGASVTYHMQSKLSEGLFHRGISQSGTNFAPWGAVAHKGVAQSRAEKMAEMMECENSNHKTMIDCLRQVPADKITKAFYEFFAWDTDPMVPFPPVVEDDHDGAFITSNPTFEKNLHGNSIPWMTGLTSEEGAMKSSPLIFNAELTEDLLKNWEKALPISLYYDHHSNDRMQEITQQINEFYFKNQKLNENTHQNLTNLYTDGWFFSAMIEYLKIRFSGPKHADTFVYLFTHKGSCSFTEIFKGGAESYWGTSHAEELQYLFPIRKDLPYFFNSIPTEQDKLISKMLTKLWVDFAYYGDPTPETSHWKSATNFPLNYLRIGNLNGKIIDEKNLAEMQTGFYSDRANFWSKIKPHYPAGHNIKNSVKNDEL